MKLSVPMPSCDNNDVVNKENPYVEAEKKDTPSHVGIEDEEVEGKKLISNQCLNIHLHILKS